MMKDKTAQPYYHDGKRVLFPGCKNQGMEYDRINGKHTGKLIGSCILSQIIMTSIFDYKGKKIIRQRDYTELKNYFPVEIFEN